jgi:Ca2+-binding EF-hand superfamily protein
MTRSLTILLLFGLIVLNLSSEKSASEMSEDEDDAPEDTGGDGDGDEHEEQDVEGLTPELLRALHYKLDENSDGKVSPKEVTNYYMNYGKRMAMQDVSKLLEDLDKSKDGLLSLEEHLEETRESTSAGGSDDSEEEAPPAKAGEDYLAIETAKFKAADANGDGLLDKPEIVSLFYPETNDKVLSIVVEESLQHKDTNKDGKLTLEEFHYHDKELIKEQKDEFKNLDANKDGFIDKNELLPFESGRFHMDESSKALFSIADDNKDLHLTADELASSTESIADSDIRHHLHMWAEEKHSEL